MKNFIQLCFIIIVLLISGCSTSSTTPISDSTTISPSLSDQSEQYYSDDEILSFVLKYSDLNETTIKLFDWPDEDVEQLENPYFFVYVASRPDVNSNSVEKRDYYTVYFGQNYGDHTARYLWIYVKKDLSEIVLTELDFEEKLEVIYPERS